MLNSEIWYQRSCFVLPASYLYPMPKQQHQGTEGYTVNREAKLKTICAEFQSINQSINMVFVGCRYMAHPWAPTIVSGKHDQKVHSWVVFWKYWYYYWLRSCFVLLSLYLHPTTNNSINILWRQHSKQIKQSWKPSVQSSMLNSEIWYHSPTLDAGFRVGIIIAVRLNVTICRISILIITGIIFVCNFIIVIIIITNIFHPVTSQCITYYKSTTAD